MKKETTTHVFALLAPPEIVPSQFNQGAMLFITHKDFYFRIVTILRCSVGSTIIIFDRAYHLECEIRAITKKEIQCIIVKKTSNNHNLPEIRCIIPLLKREALETLIDSLTQLGATSIELISTQKTHRSKIDQKELDRLERIVGAAAEQSKNYRFPLIKKAESLLSVSFEKTTTLFLDPEGLNCFELLKKISSQYHQSITLIIGPEGDLAPHEKDFLREKNVIFMALTPTILRAELAAAVVLGAVRSFFNNKKIDS